MGFTSTDVDIVGEGPRLDAFIAHGEGAPERSPAAILIHGFPSPTRPGPPSRTYHQLAERIADELGWTTLALSLRGCGESDGEFSVSGWIDDVRRATDHLEALGAAGVWLVGSTTGGSLAILAGAADERVRGVAVAGARADFDDWAREPKRLLDHCRTVNVIKHEDSPADFETWASELETERPIDRIAALADRPVLILHGERDRQVPARDARDLADAHGSAELRILHGGDHRLRNDPRCVALLLGWLERQQVGD